MTQEILRMSILCPKSSKDFYHHIKFLKSNEQGVFYKKSLKILQYSQENTCVGVSFLIKMQTFRSTTLLKEDSNAGVFLTILRKFEEQLF